jgi:subtilisin family serine protease
MLIIRQGYGFEGNAPGVTIGAYRAGNCKDEFTDADILAAILRAVKDGCDVINMPIGSPSGWSASAFSVAATRAVKKGVVVVVAAGNDGSVRSPGDPRSLADLCRKASSMAARPETQSARFLSPRSTPTPSLLSRHSCRTAKRFRTSALYRSSKWASACRS